MMPMKWRIAGKKLQYMRKVQTKGYDNITKRALQQEVKTGTKGSAHECLELSNELGQLPKRYMKKHGKQWRTAKKSETGSHSTRMTTVTSNACPYHKPECGSDTGLEQSPK